MVNGITLVRVSVGTILAGWLIVSACGGGVAGPGANTPNQAQASSSASDTTTGVDTPPVGPPRDVDCGDFTTCAVAADGAAHCWGRDKGGELGDGKGGERVKRGLVPGIGKVRKIALGSQFGCALLEDKKVSCWGSGRIANDGRAVIDVKPTLVNGVDGVEELVASGVIACARGSKGIICWGSDEKTIGTPPKGDYKQIAAGFTHACALDNAGAITCWGQSDWGTGGLYAKPPITGALQVVTGDRHACVLTKDKAVQCWGMNDAGQLGTKPDTESHKNPTTVPGITKATKLIAGDASTCAVLGDGSVRCWGSNGEGELGFGKRSSDERPSRVAIGDVDQICIASAHGCALTKQSKLLCWGANAFGQLGDGTKERRPSPTPVVW